MSNAATKSEIPSAHHLKAACWVARFFVAARSMPRAEARAAYGRAATDGLFDSQDLERGELVLWAAELVRVEGELVAVEDALSAAVGLGHDKLVELMLERLLLNQRPLWLSAALTPTGIDDAMVPDDVRKGLVGAISDPGRREALLLALSRRFDDAERRRTGEIAEKYLIAACRAELVEAGRTDLAADVQRVSLVSDQLGYDVTAPRLNGGTRRIESKGTRATGSIVSVYVTRNEAMTGLRDPSWSLAVSRVGPDNEALIVGWLDGEALRPLLPSDPDKGGHWQSAVIYVDTGVDLQPGLPPC